MLRQVPSRRLLLFAMLYTFLPMSLAASVAIYAQTGLSGSGLSCGNEIANLISIVQKFINDGGEFTGWTIDASLRSFSNVTATQEVLDRNDFFFMPDMEGTPSGWGSAAQAQMKQWVMSGKVLFMTGTSGPKDAQFLNAIFGWDTTSVSCQNAPINSAAAVGTPFEGETVTLGCPSATDHLNCGSANCAVIAGTTTSAAVAAFTVGAGKVVYVGFDYFATGYGVALSAGAGYTGTMSNCFQRTDAWVTVALKMSLVWSNNLATAAALAVWLPCSLQAPDNGTLGATCNSSLTGAFGTCDDFSCNAPFIRNGTFTCNNGTVTTRGRCDPPPCTTVMPANSVVSSCAATLQHGQTCTPTCSVGYSRSGTISCNLGTPTAATCTIKTCPAFALSVGMSMGNCSTTSLTHGQTCVPSCAAGYGRAGEFSCWDGALVGTSTCYPLPCPNHPMPANSVVTSCGNRHLNHTETCTPTCLPGYTVSGTISCSLGATSAAAVCNPNPCTTVMPANSVVSSCAATLQHGQTCTPTCNVGYTLSAGSMICNLGNLSSSYECVPDMGLQMTVPTFMCAGYSNDHLQLAPQLPSYWPTSRQVTLVLNITEGSRSYIASITNGQTFSVDSQFLMPGGHGSGVRHHQYSVQVTSTDTLARSGPANADSKKIASIVKSMYVYYVTPPVDIEQPLSVAAVGDEDAQFTTRIVAWAHPGCLLDASLLAQHPVQYAWSFKKVGNPSILASSAKGGITTFAVPSSVLEPLNFYQLKLATSYVGYNLSTHTTIVSIYVEPAVLAVAIQEGPVYGLNLQQQTSLTLHAEVSDRDLASKTYNWVLTDKNGATAWSVSNGSSIASIPTAGLSSNNAPYIAAVAVSKYGLPSVTANATITITTTVVPSVSVTGLHSITTTKPLSLLARASLIGAACTGCTYQWSSSQISGSQLQAYSIAGTSSPQFTIGPNQLGVGTYSFTCTVTSAAGISGSSSYSVTVTSPPSIGGVSAQVTTTYVGFDVNAATYGPFPENVTGTFYETQITLGAANITGITSTLTYQFGYILEPSTSITWIGPPSSATTYETKRLPAGTMYPVVRIATGYGSSQIWVTKTSTHPVIITMPAAAGDDVASYLEAQATSLLAASAGDDSASQRLIGSMAETLSRSTNNSAASIRSKKKVLKRLSLALEESSHGADASTVFSNSLALTESAPQLLDQQAQEAILKATKRALSGSKSISPDVGVSALKAFNNLGVASTTSTVPLSEEALNNRTDEIKRGTRDVHIKVAVAMVVGQDPVEISPSNKTRTFVYKHTSAGILNQRIGACILHSLTGLPATVVGSGVKTQPDAYNRNRAADNTTLSHSTHGLTMMDELGTVYKLTSTNASCDPPDPPPVYPVCKFFNESTKLWDTSGLTLNELGRCVSTHLTDFTQFPGTAPVPSSTSSCYLCPLWILLGCLAGCFCFAVAGVVFFKYRKQPEPEAKIPKVVDDPVPPVELNIPQQLEIQDDNKFRTCC